MNKKLRTRKTTKEIESNDLGIVVVVMVLSILFFVLLFRLGLQDIANKEANDITGNVVLENNILDNVVRELDIIGDEFGRKVSVGGLEITVNRADESEYAIKVLKIVDITGQEILTFDRVHKNYGRIYLTAFNPTPENKIFASIKLIDNLGNEYQADSNPDPDLFLHEFGKDLIVSPSTLRRGFLFFLDIDETARDLQLIFELESGEKKVFEFKRGGKHEA